jgi:hypothetical protein
MAKGEIFTGWVSKYALTEGIRAARVQDCGDGLVNVLKADGTSGWGYLHGEGREWHKTRDGAVERAEVMRENKIKSIKKQLAKLEAMTFTIPPSHSEAP